MPYGVSVCRVHLYAHVEKVCRECTRVLVSVYTVCRVCVECGVSARRAHLYVHA